MPTDKQMNRVRALRAIDQLERCRLEDERRIWIEVQNARQWGASWSAIGTLLGITKQAAQKRYDRRLPGI